MTTPDDVRARFGAWSNAPNKPFAPLCEWYALDPVRGYGWACFHAGYRAAHADLAGEVRELVEADREYDEAQKAYGDSITKDTEVTRRAWVRLSKACERRASALAKFTQEKP